jgi:AAA domain
VLELVGPAGVGKSTLAADLGNRLSTTPRAIWGQPVVPLLGNGMRSLPTLVDFWASARSPLWHEARHIVRLRTLHRALRNTNSRSDEIVIFDEGPVFSLTWLRGFGHPKLRHSPSDAWWRAAFHDWGALIDTVVVLEAPDDLLARRIRGRPENHEVKEFPNPEIALWMGRFREALDWVLNGMAQNGGPAVLRLATDKEPADRIAGRVLASLQRGADGN